MRFNSLKNRIPRHVPRAHLEQALGKPELCRDYCKKGEQPHYEWEDCKSLGPNWGINLNLFFEEGTMKTMGQRSDLEAIIEEGKSLRDETIISHVTLFRRPVPQFAFSTRFSAAIALTE